MSETKFRGWVSILGIFILLFVVVCVAIYYFAFRVNISGKEIIIRSAGLNSTNRGVIYHAKSYFYQHDTAASPFNEFSEAWDDRDSNRTMYISWDDSGYLFSSGFDLDTKWSINYKKGTYKLYHYYYSKPEERDVKNSEDIEYLNRPPDTSGITAVKKRILPHVFCDRGLFFPFLSGLESKLFCSKGNGGPLVYLVFQNNDVEVYDAKTFRYLGYERYEYKDGQKYVWQTHVSITSENISRTEENLKKIFAIPAVPKGFKIMESNFDYSKNHGSSDFICDDGNAYTDVVTPGYRNLDCS